MSSIGRSFERDSSSIHPLISRTGGIRPLERKRFRLGTDIGGARRDISRPSGRSIIALHRRAIVAISINNQS